MNRVAVVDGVRTPFQKQATGFGKMSALQLGTAVVSELLARSGLRGSEVDQVVFGQVLPSIEAPNIAREVVLAAGLGTKVDAFSVSRACATSYQSAISAAQSIWDGSNQCAIAGGADSASDVPIVVSKKLASALLLASRAKSLADRLSAFAPLRPLDLLPVPPAVREFSTGLSMGQSAEKMAQENQISRSAQDEFAHLSHSRATRAWEDGHFDSLVMPVSRLPDHEMVVSDNVLRRESTLDSYARLKPAFDKKHGTVTAGNSSALTDGAAAVLLMQEEKAAALGMKPLGYIRSYAFSALNPREQLLLGPAYATPVALRRAGLSLNDMDIIDMHEAFSAQVLSNLQAFSSKSFAQSKLGQDEMIGEVDPDKLNVWGGSLALGHPFAATGARQVHQALSALRLRGGQFALCTACAAGGLGVSIVLEAA